jgi:AcrR family transcriptional regulator
MDELASAAGVSRATLYRLFPDKPRLFRELVRTYSPWEPLSATVQVMHDRPPREVMPALARALVTARGVRAGMLGRMLLEVIRGGADTEEGAAYALGGPLPVLARYLTEQMTAGRLRRMHPLVAFQAFVGPIVIHLMTRRVAESRMGLKLSTDEVVAEFVRAWLRAMTPAEAKR